MNAAAFRLARQDLKRRTSDGMEAVARRLCGLHAQVLSSADLILWARVRGHRPGALDKALWEERSLVKTWLMRGTLHLVPADDLPLYVGALDTRGTYQGAWLRWFEVTAPQMERLIETVANALDGRCLTREELVAEVRPRAGAAMAERLLSGWGSFLKPAATRGLLCFGPNRGRNVTFTRPDRWLGAWEAPPDRTEARTELLRRFLRTYGPARADDFERWLGGGRRVPEPWEALSDDLVEVAPKTFALAGDRAELARARPAAVRLLPAFDPFVLHPTSERPVPPEHRASVYRTAGWVSQTVVERGRVVGVWEHRRRGQKVAVTIRPFAPLGTGTAAAVTREARALARYLGGDLELVGLD